MKQLRWLTCLLTAGLTFACDGPATDPVFRDTEATFKVDRYSETEIWFDTPYTALYECANDGRGELLDGWGTWTVHLSGHFTPSVVRPGGSRASWSGLPEDHPEYMGPEYLLIGQTSGDVWAVDGKRSKFMEHRTKLPDGSSGYHQTLNIFAVRADGEKLHIQGSYQYKWADGGITMYNVNRGSCPEIW